MATLTDDQAPAGTDAVAAARAVRVCHLAARLQMALDQAAATSTAIETLAQPVSGATPGRSSSGVSAAGLLAAALGHRRFTTEAQLASYAGVAPLEASSGAQTRHRLNRGGNRQLDALLHRIALVQLRCSPEAKAYVAKRRKEGKTQREALRCLKRFLARRVFHSWQHCTLPPLAEVTIPLI